MRPEPAYFVPSLADQGYCYTNRGARILARIDAPDWLERLGQFIRENGFPPGADFYRVREGDRQHLADLYRRHLSADRLRIPFHFAEVPGSSGLKAPCDYRPKLLAWDQRPAGDLVHPRPCHPVDSWEGSDTHNHPEGKTE